MLHKKLRTCLYFIRPTIKSYIVRKQSEQGKNVNGKLKFFLKTGKKVFANDPGELLKRSQATVPRLAVEHSNP